MTTGPLTDTTELEAFRSGDPQTLLDQAEARVRAYCGWHIAPSVQTVVTLYPNGRNLLLPSAYVTSIDSVADADTTFDAATYRLRDAAYLENFGSWTRNRPLTVTFTHGYTETPADVQQVVHDVVNRAMDAVRSPGLSRKRVGDVDRAWLAGDKVTLTEDNKQALAPYRIVAFA